MCACVCMCVGDVCVFICLCVRVYMSLFDRAWGGERGRVEKKKK